MKQTQNTFYVKKLVEFSKSSGWAIGRPVGLNDRPVGKTVDQLGLERSVFHSCEPVEPTIYRLDVVAHPKTIRENGLPVVRNDRPVEYNNHISTARK